MPILYIFKHDTNLKHNQSESKLTKTIEFDKNSQEWRKTSKIEEKDNWQTWLQIIKMTIYVDLKKDLTAFDHRLMNKL